MGTVDDEETEEGGRDKEEDDDDDCEDAAADDDDDGGNSAVARFDLAAGGCDIDGARLEEEDRTEPIRGDMDGRDEEDDGLETAGAEEEEWERKEEAVRGKGDCCPTRSDGGGAAAPDDGGATGCECESRVNRTLIMRPRREAPRACCSCWGTAD